MADAVHDAQRLKELQALPLHRKIQISQARIIEWYTRNKGNVVVSFSGGKDSTVLLHLVRSLFPDVPAVFSNTGLEYPEIQRFVRTFPNVTIVSPKMNFSEVISTYGYPLIGKEVAEAIYYARRIRSQIINVEREQERRNAVETGRTLRLPENDGGGVWHCRRELLGQRTLHRHQRREEPTDDPPRKVGGGSQPGCSCKGNSQAGGGYLETHRRRNDIRGLHQAHGREITRTSEPGNDGISQGDAEPG